MITLRLNGFSDDEVRDLIARFEVINPKGTKRCLDCECADCNVKHICYSISNAIDYADAFLDGRDSK